MRKQLIVDCRRLARGPPCHRSHDRFAAQRGNPRGGPSDVCGFPEVDSPRAPGPRMALQSKWAFNYIRILYHRPSGRDCAEYPSKRILLVAMLVLKKLVSSEAL